MYRLSQIIRTQRLPICQYKDHVMAHIKGKRVTCIHGETGCGKSTMVPLFITEMFYDMRPKLNIVVSQPRRMAAKNLANRVSSLLGEEEGKTVGYKISGEVKVSKSTKITYLTTGYLLQILVNNPDQFKTFTHIILDEIHERQTDNDLLSLIVKLCMKKYNADTKIIVMSATLQGELFSRYFSQADVLLKHSPPHPIFVGVKSYNITEFYLDNYFHYRRRYCDFSVDEHGSFIRALRNFNDIPAPNVGKDLMEIGKQIIQEHSRPGESTLVFLPGIFEIQDMYDILEPLERKSQTEKCIKKYRIFVLHSQVPRDEQMAVFKEPSHDTVHVILATNIAESSLTLPKVRIVIDYGIRKQLLYDSKCKMTVLKNSWISKASACQRKGRTGRVFEGIVFRMFTKNFHDRLEEFDPPEIETSPLDKLVLKVKHMLKNIVPDKTVSSILAEAVQPPQVDQLPEAIERLADIGALTENHEQADITLLGEVAISLPVDLLLCRLAVYGALFDCVCDAVVMAAAISLRMEPFTLPMIMIMKNVGAFRRSLNRSFEARIAFDSGEYSESIMMRNLMEKWLLELKKRGYEDTGDVHNVDVPQGAAKDSKKSINHLRKQFSRDNAVDAKRLREFENAVADIASRMARFLKPGSIQHLKLSALMKILHTEEEAENTGEIFDRDVSSYTEENHDKLTIPSKDIDKLNDISFSCPSLLFEKDALLLKSLLTASFSPYFVKGTCFDDMKRHGISLMVNKSERTANAMKSHGVNPMASLALNNILSNENRFFRGDQMLIRNIVSLTCNPKKIAIEADRVFLEFDPSHSLPQQRSLVHDIPFEAHLLNQFGDGRNKFMVPLEKGSPAQRKCRRDQITFDRPVQPYKVNWVYKHQKAEEVACERIMQGTSYSCRNPVGFMCDTRGPDIEHYAVAAKINGKSGRDGSQGCTLTHLTVLPSENDGIFAKVIMLMFTSHRIKIEFIVTNTRPSIIKSVNLSGQEISFTDDHPLRSDWLPLINVVRDEISRAFQDQYFGHRGKIYIPSYCLIKENLKKLFNTIKENKGTKYNTEGYLNTRNVYPFHSDTNRHMLKPFVKLE